MNGLLVQLLLTILIVAFSAEVVEGVKVTTKVVELFAATEEAGAVVTLKSEAFVPLKLMVPTVRAFAPVLLIV